VSSEIVGLIPKLALEHAAEWFLQVENFDSSLIFENRLADVMSGKAVPGSLNASLRAGPSSGIAPFIEQLAAPTATPGGGSAAAASGAMAAGLAAMVATMSRGKKAYLEHDAALGEAIARLSTLREELKTAIDADAESYTPVMAAYKAAKASPDGSAAIAAALRHAADVPLSVAGHASEIEQIAVSLRSITNPRMSSDLTTSIALAKAAVAGALANVEVNLESLEADGPKPLPPDDAAFATETRARVTGLRILL
jgi:formiminotetrahydrofolate cyclodeaminase